MRSLCCALILVSTAGVSEIRAAPIIWGLGNGHAYEMITASSPMTWQEAKVAASLYVPDPFDFSAGAFRTPHLATILSRSEELFFDVHFTPGAPAWIGFTDEVLEGEWRWIVNPLEISREYGPTSDPYYAPDGLRQRENDPLNPVIWQDPRNFTTPIQTAYANWGPGEPATENHYGLFNPVAGGHGNWSGGGPNWMTGSGAAERYIVEWERTPEPATILLALFGAALLGVRLWTRR